MSQSRRQCIPCLIAAMALGLSTLMSADSATALQEAGQAIQPPQVLMDAGLFASAQEPTPEAGLSWAQVVDKVKPGPWPEAQEQPAGPLPAEVSDLISQAEQASQKGESFRAIKLLKQAEALAPDQPKVARALGLAYADSGNLTRAAAYLRAMLSAQRDDVEALLVLSRHAAQSGRLEEVLTYSEVLKQAKAPAALIAYDLATACGRRGYVRAAADRLNQAVESLPGDDPEEVKALAALPTRVRVELEVIRTIVPQLQIELGDLLLQSGDRAAASKAYSQIEFKDPAARQSLFARRVYLAVLDKDLDQAIDQALALLWFDDASANDAQLVAYLLKQGVAANVMSPRIDGIVADQGATMPRLDALAMVAPRDTLLKRVEAWLEDATLTEASLLQAIDLFAFDDDDPADAKPLTQLLSIVADRVTGQPEQALALSRATLQDFAAPITLLRAIQSDAWQAKEGWAHRLVTAAAYQSTGRRRDAIASYSELLTADEAIAEQVLLPVVRLQLELGLAEQAYALLGKPELDEDWVTLDLSLRAMAATGKAREALEVVDAYIRDNGKQLRSDVLRIELIAQMGQPAEACNLLLRLISNNPSEERLYRLGIDLAYDYRAFFSRTSDADRMRRAFLTRLISNLPDSSLARIGMAQNIKSNPARIDEAEKLLLGVLEKEPANTTALALLIEMYDEAGNEQAAADAHERYANAVGPGLPGVLLRADRALTRGQNRQAAEVLERALQLEEQGVLPGDEMTGDQASLLLRHLEAADPKQDTEALYLAMVRRFPDHAGLNNALGYRWAVENKNLRQAQAMIERALKQEPTNHSLLDSLAWVQYKLGEFEAAYNTQSRALLFLDALLARNHGLEEQVGSTIAILNDHMGDILYKLEDPRKALLHWREAGDQTYTEEDMLFDPELRSLAGRLKAKIDAMAADKPAPVAEVPGPESHGPEGHPADTEPAEEAPGG